MAPGNTQLILCYVAKRLLLAIPVLIGAALATFLLTHLVPGDPALAVLGTEADEVALAALRRSLALDRPLATQFAGWLGHVCVGDFGRSFQTGRAVLPMLTAAIGATGSLVGTALCVAVLVGVPCGVFAASHPQSAGSRSLTILSLVGISVPGFWLGLLLILGFAIRVPVFPASGHVALSQDPAGHLAHLALPAMTLAIGLTSATTRITRTAMLQALRAPHMRTALAKGLTRNRTIWAHALVCARGTILVQLAVMTGRLMAGVVVIETVFSWPGIGKLVVDGVFARDHPVIQGSVLLISAMLVVVNLLADLAHAILDPRARGQ